MVLENYSLKEQNNIKFLKSQLPSKRWYRKNYKKEKTKKCRKRDRFEDNTTNEYGLGDVQMDIKIKKKKITVITTY